MCRIKVLLGLAVILAVASASIASNAIYVAVNSPNDPGSGTYTDPFRRIQDAINIAVDNDTIEIQPGLYTGNGNYNLNPNGKSITIRSVDPNTPADTIIDPNKAGRGFIFQSGENTDCILSGLTLRNGSTIVGNNGGNIYCYDSSPTIRNCVIIDGHAEKTGGGICLNYGSATIINCTITGNTADFYGGGIGCEFSSPLITGSTVNGNIAYGRGGGIDSGQSNPNIINCIIINNLAPVGGGINCYYPGRALGGGLYGTEEGSACR